MALYTDFEEIYLMKKSGDVIMYDATEKKEHVKISNVIKVNKPNLFSLAGQFLLIKIYFWLFLKESFN